MNGTREYKYIGKNSLAVLSGEDEFSSKGNVRMLKLPPPISQCSLRQKYKQRMPYTVLCPCMKGSFFRSPLIVE